MKAASLYENLTSEQKEQWSNLLHFEKSETNPALSFNTFSTELKEGAFQAKYGRFKLILPCAYPARVQFLKNVLSKDLPKYDCPDFELWRREVRPEKMSIVFSTAYPNNPASMFGHTFIRFHSKKKGSDLLDYGANYSALTHQSDNGLLYAIKGIFGGYKGYFDLAPYYIKLNEYLYGEDRDLIEYELNLKQEDLKFYLAHLWELYQASDFNYYFFYENCSYQLLKLLEAKPNVKFIKRRRWYYLPSDLIHQIYERTDFVSKIKSRPSRSRMVESVLNSLNPKQRENVKQAYQKGTLKNLTKDEQLGLLELLNFKKFQQREEFKYGELLRSLLSKIAKSDTTAPHIYQGDFENLPHLSHQPQKVAFSFSKESHQEVIGLEFKSGFQDLLARDLGLEAFGGFEFLSLRMGYFTKEKAIRLQRAQLIEITSLHPYRFYNKQLSWKLGLRFEDMPERGPCRSCLRTRGEAKMGITFGNRNHISSFLLGAVSEYSARYEPKLKNNLAYELLFGLSFSKSRLKALLSFEGLFDIRAPGVQFRHNLFTGLNYSLSPNWEMRLTTELSFLNKTWENRGNRTTLSLGAYF